MAVLKGTISGSIKSTAYNIAGTIKSIGLYNRHTSAVVVSVGISSGTTDYYFKGSNLAATLTTGFSELTLTDVTVPANWQILIVSTGPVDYFLSID